MESEQLAWRLRPHAWQLLFRFHCIRCNVEIRCKAWCVQRMQRIPAVARWENEVPRRNFTFNPASDLHKINTDCREERWISASMSRSGRRVPGSLLFPLTCESSCVMVRIA